MQGVATGFRQNLYRGSAIAAIGSVVLPGHYLEFFQGIWIRHRKATGKRACAEIVVDLHAIHLKVVVIGRTAIRGEAIACGSQA